MLTSRTSSEHLFSKTKLILRRNRQRLMNDTFEKHLLLMSNKDLLIS
uniref:Uncharacterized protein n=1 Tax=Lepeophtheirus salmonis TaxID=72036 RepID=A0A0K2TGZ2_LEPSM